MVIGLQARCVGTPDGLVVYGGAILGLAPGLALSVVLLASAMWRSVCLLLALVWWWCVGDVVHDIGGQFF